jgi:hypothetical protein
MHSEQKVCAQLVIMGVLKKSLQTWQRTTVSRSERGGIVVCEKSVGSDIESMAEGVGELPRRRKLLDKLMNALRKIGDKRQERHNANSRDQTSGSGIQAPRPQVLQVTRDGMTACHMMARMPGPLSDERLITLASGILIKRRRCAVHCTLIVHLKERFESIIRLGYQTARSVKHRPRWLRQRPGCGVLHDCIQVAQSSAAR